MNKGLTGLNLREWTRETKAKNNGPDTLFVSGKHRFFGLPDT